MSGKLYLVRHGESRGNVWPHAYKDDGTNYLSDYGIKQAELCGAYFRRMDIKFYHCVASKLNRANMTMSLILNQMDTHKEWHSDIRFNELHGEELSDPRSGIPIREALDVYTKMLEHGNVLIVSHYHAMQYIFDTLAVTRHRVESHGGKQVHNAQPFVWDPADSQAIKLLDLYNLGPQH